MATGENGRERPSTWTSRNPPPRPLHPRGAAGDAGGRSQRGRIGFFVALAIVVGGLAVFRFAPGSSARQALPGPTVEALAKLGLDTTAIPGLGARTPIGNASGELENPASPFDIELPAISRLDATLLTAVQDAARDAAADGVPFSITSGWRSATYQQRLLDEAVAEYGSLDEALRYVATADTSAHVTGHAVDIGPAEADDWLRRHGARYGLCQAYANEAWHFELATEPGGSCPRMKADASQ